MEKSEPLLEQVILGQLSDIHHHSSDVAVRLSHTLSRCTPIIFQRLLFKSPLTIISFILICSHLKNVKQTPQKSHNIHLFHQKNTTNPMGKPARHSHGIQTSPQPYQSWGKACNDIPCLKRLSVRWHNIHTRTYVYVYIYIMVYIYI